MRALITIAAISLALGTTSRAQNVPQYVRTADLKAWYSFTGNTLDSGGSGLNLTNYGATLTSDRYGAANRAYSFDGTGSNMKRDAFPVLPNPWAFSLSCWIKKSTGSTGTFACKGTCSATENHLGYYLHASATDNIGGGGFYTDGTNPALDFVDGASTSWQNVTLTFGNPDWKLYVNGAMVGWGTLATATGLNNYADDPLYIGYTVWNGASTSYFKGKIDDIGIWNNWLSPCDVKKLYSSCIHSTVANQTAPAGSTAVFSFSNTCYSSVGITYQWQGDLGSGYANLSNAGQYSGVTTTALSISGLYAADNNAHFRCIISNGICSDTTNVAVLTLGTTGTAEVSKPVNISLFPNPNKGSFTLTYTMPSAGAVFNVKDLTGRIVYTHAVSNTNGTENLEIPSLDNGLYIWEMSSSNGSLEVGKIVIAK